MAAPGLGPGRGVLRRKPIDSITDEGGGESQGGSPGGDNKPDPLPPEEGDPSNEGKPAA